MVVFENKKNALAQKYLGFYNELGFKHVLFSPFLFCAIRKC